MQYRDCNEPYPTLSRPRSTVHKERKLGTEWNNHDGVRMRASPFTSSQIISQHTDKLRELHPSCHLLQKHHQN